MGTMSGMATLVTLPRPRAPRSAQEPIAPTRHKVTMVATCYAGLAALVALAFVIRAVAPDPVGVVRFVAAAATLVGILHPRGSRVAARRTLRS